MEQNSNDYSSKQAALKDLHDRVEALRQEIFQVRNDGDTDMASAQALLSDVRDILLTRLAK